MSISDHTVLSGKALHSAGLILSRRFYEDFLERLVLRASSALGIPRPGLPELLGACGLSVLPASSVKTSTSVVVLMLLSGVCSIGLISLDTVVIVRPDLLSGL